MGLAKNIVTIDDYDNTMEEVAQLSELRTGLCLQHAFKLRRSLEMALIAYGVP